MKQRIEDPRRPGFCWAENDAVTAILEGVNGRRANTTLGVYLGFVYVASSKRDGQHLGFEGTRKEICDACGVNSVTLREYVEILEGLKLLRVDEEPGKVNTWVLLDPPLRLVPPSETDPRQETTGVNRQPVPPSETDPPPPSEIDGGTTYKEEPEERKNNNNVAPEVRRLSLLMAQLQDQRGGGETNYAARAETKAWLDPIRKLIDLDHKTPAHIEAAIRWVHGHEFEASVVLSPGKLRKRWDDLSVKARRERERRRRRSPHSDPGRAERNARRRELWGASDD